MCDLQDRYITLTEWSENRAIESRMRNFLGDLAKRKEINKTLVIAPIPDSAYARAGEVLKTWFNSIDTDNRPYNATYYIKDAVQSENRGNTKPAKYIAKLLKDRYGLKIPNEIKAELGHILTPGEKQKITVRFTMGCEGEAEDYYNADSCWFNRNGYNYGSSRDYLEATHGGAIRIYDESGDIIGRSWFVPYKDSNLFGMVLFNVYGDGQLDHTYYWGDFVAEVLHVKQQNTRMYVSKSGGNPFHLNSEHTVLVGNVNNPNSDRITVDVRFNTPTSWDYYYEDNNMCTCDDCGELTNEDHMYYIDSGGYYVCEHCYEYNYSYVDNGDYEGYFPIDDITEVQHYTRTGCLTYSYFHVNDSNIVEIRGDYYHIDMCVLDEYGDYHLQDDDDYVICPDGTVYPTEDCEENEDGEWWPK